MDKAPQRGRLPGEEAHRAPGDMVPVADVRVKEVTGAAHNVAHVALHDVLGGEQTISALLGADNSPVQG